MSHARRILVTGASKGIGRATALRLARDGFDLALHCLKDVAGIEALRADISGLGRGATLLQCDVADREACRNAIEADIATAGPYYGVVLNAGVARDGVFPATDGADWDAVLRTDLDGFYNVLHPCLMPMIGARRGGRIVTLASVSGLIGVRGQVNYSAAKAGVIGATKALAVELASRGITVNCVAPGFIETQMTSEVPAERVKDMVPMGRMGRPEDVAAAISFLCSDEAGYVTRQVLSVNGGLI